MEIWNVIGSVLASVGGASIIVAGLAQFLGRVWAERIAKQTVARFDRELEVVKASNTFALEEFKRKSDTELKNREQFGGISSQVYQDFFRNRVSTYQALLEIKNDYVSRMHEDAVADEMERWGDSYYSVYVALRRLIVEKQLYISTELENVFHELRLGAATYIKEADISEGHALGQGADPFEAGEERSEAHEKLATKTHKLMNKVFEQVGSDVSKLRARIELDKAPNAFS